MHTTLCCISKSSLALIPVLRITPSGQDLMLPTVPVVSELSMTEPHHGLWLFITLLYFLIRIPSHLFALANSVGNDELKQSLPLGGLADFILSHSLLLSLLNLFVS